MISAVRRVAQTLRHAPGLRSLTPVWSVLRSPYLRFMNWLGSTSGIIVKVGGAPMRLHPEFATQNWETVEYESYRAFAALLRPGDVVFDVGAHIGTYTLLALQGIGEHGRVVAFEPFAHTRRYLEQHVEWAGARDRVTVRDVCLGAEPGRQTFYYAPDRAEGMAGLVPVEGFKEEMIGVTTLDHEAARLGFVPSIIKIDVEGAEWDVLKGADRTLREKHPRISLSIHPQALAKRGTVPDDVLAWLADRDYQSRIVARDHEIHVVCV